MAKLRRELTVGFSRGSFDSVAPPRFPPESAAEILNGRIEPDGTVKRRPGSQRTHPTLLAAGTGWGGTAFETAAGDPQMLAFCGAKAFMSDDFGATWTEIASGLREDYYDFAQMRVGATNYLFAANGDTTIKRWDGTTWDTLPNAPSGVKFVKEFNRRLRVAGHSGVLVQGSKIGDPTVWAAPDGDTLQVIEVPTGMRQLGSHLLVFGTDSTALVDGFGEQTILVTAGESGFSRSVGCVAFRTIVAVGDNGVAWLSKRGVEYYAAGSGIQLVSKARQRFMDAISWNSIDDNRGKFTAAYNPRTQDYHLAVSTDGIRNNRILVLNLTQNVQDQRRGARSAATVDRQQGAGAGDQFLSVDADGYLASGASGVGAILDSRGYLSLGTGADPGDALEIDADGYLSSVTDDTLPSTLFLGPSDTEPTVLYSVGYDGFVRRHEDAEADDVLSDGTGGTDVELDLISKPFLFGQPSQRKRGRIVHLATIAEAQATVRVSLRGEGSETDPVTVTMPASGTDQTVRRRAMLKLDADAPQVRLRTTDDVRIALVGLSAELLRERA